MLIFPEKYRKHHKRASIPAGNPSPPGVTVVSVFVVDSATLQWNFSADIASLDSNVEQLIASVPDGFEGPSGVTQVGPAALWAAYPDGNFGEGETWQVNEEPVGMSFAGGALMVIPESGDLQM